ncbi:MAG TPA: hypothetical protein VMQ40_02710 [Acidimicrobiales bacterium]|nr:hypothetical protein [Acidimicrobiales bacterium]
MAAVCAAALLAASATSAAGAGHASAVAPPRALSMVQYTSTNPEPQPWIAHLVSGANPQLAAGGGPRAAPDANGGVQVAYKNARGDLEWLDGSSVGQFSAVDLTRLLGFAPLVGQPVPVVSSHGLDEVLCVTSSGHLLELTLNPYRRLPFRTGTQLSSLSDWTRSDLTDAAGPRATGTPSVVVQAGVTSVFVRNASGELIEFASDNRGGRVWNAYDLTAISHGPRVATDPTAFFDPGSGQVRVAASDRPRGAVVVYAPTDVGGRVWNYQNVSAVTHTSTVSGGLAAAVYDGQPILFAAGRTGDLTEYVGADAGRTTDWATTDVTATTAGSPPIAGTPSVAVSGSRLVIAGIAAAWGDLFEWQSTRETGPFTATDVSSTGQGPARTAAGTPAAVFVSGALSLFAAGVAVPAPEGTGVYSVPSSKWAQALKDDWPILGVTGGLGARCAPWTQYPQPASKPEPDRFVGQTIQASHLRVTWLSLWTVSGPGTTPSGCAGEKGPITSATFYAHGFAAGQWVATQIDTYRADGLGLKPDWVLFDPEGYPDNHSGLWGPTSPPSALAKSIADYASILDGWRNGMASVDPSLKAAFYATQHEYMTYRLFNLALPAFIAGSFSKPPGKQLVAPTRTAFGPNIRGFVMYNSGFTPSCVEVTNERLLLTEAPWDGNYNTIQMPPRRYCPPGQAPPG